MIHEFYILQHACPNSHCAKPYGSVKEKSVNALEVLEKLPYPPNFLAAESRTAASSLFLDFNSQAHMESLCIVRVSEAL